MANGGTWQSELEWQRAEAPLLQLDGALATFASHFGLGLTKNHKDWPERSLAWGDGIHRLIQVYLANQRDLTFNVWLCAWQDRNGKRYWKQELLVKERRVPEFGAEFYALLAESKERLDSWSECELEFATALG